MTTREIPDPSGLTPDRYAYQKRCEAVYWRGVPSCKAKGPHGARCVLEPDHSGNVHEGNGNPDPFGPAYYSWLTKP